MKSSSLQEISIFPTLMAGFPPSKLSFTPTTKVSDLLKSGESIDVRWVCTSEPPSNKRKKSGGTASSSSKKKKKGKGERGAAQRSTNSFIFSCSGVESSCLGVEIVLGGRIRALG